MIRNWSALLILCFIFPLVQQSEIMAQSTEDIRKLRLSFHIFNDDGGLGNFQADSTEHLRFFNELTNWINHKMLNLDVLKPEVESAYVKSTHTQIIIDTILFYQDTYAWDCSDSLDSEYMRHVHVDQNDWMDYQQKHKTLPVFFGGNYGVVGGHVGKIGSKRLIAMRGIYTMYQNIGFDKTVYECGRNIFHELGHAMGLNHNFQGGVSGDQCDECEDNGCPQEGTSNNLMDYWPAYGGGVSVCQLDIIDRHLNGELGSIGDIVINDSCYTISDQEPRIISDYVEVSDTLYVRRPWHIEKGGVLEITGTLSVGHGLKLKVYQGGELILNGGVITNLCGDIWDGIEAVGQASEAVPIVTISGNSVIEHARIAVHALGSAKLNITQASFSNCINSILLSSCKVEDNYFGGLTFNTPDRYHRTEEGARLNSCISLDNSSMVVINSFFMNDNQFATQSAVESGTGILVHDSNLESYGNVFQFLTHGIKAKRIDNEGFVKILNNQFDYCVNSVFNDGYAYMYIDQSIFNINKFEGINATGIISNSAAWMLVENSQFVSDFGGGGIIGIYSRGSRGGTKLIRRNNFADLDWGVIHIPDLNEPFWPTDSPNEFGLVMDQNTYNKVPLQYTFQTPGGQGLAQTNNDFPKDLGRFEESLSWSVGGLGGVANQNNLVLVDQADSESSRKYPQQNFFINSKSNSNLEKELPDLSYDSILAQWIEPQFIEVDPNSAVSAWIDASQIFEENPHFLRHSEIVEQYLYQMSEWPLWALEQFINIASQADQFDEALAYYISKFAGESFLNIQVSDLALPRQLNLPDSVSDLLLSDISPPTDLFLPVFTRPDQDESPDFQLYPNPVSDLLFIMPDQATSIQISSALRYEIYTSTGKLVKSGSISSIGNMNLRVDKLSSGLYTICLRDVKTFYGAKKFIILHP